MTGRPVLCPYCDKPAALITGAKLYRNRPDLAHLHFWRCAPCDAHVGCHKAGMGQGDGTKPFGRLANAELRRAKTMAHAAFDPLWRSRRMRRREAYAWLARQLGISVENCHIGAFDLDGCCAVIAAVQARAARDRSTLWETPR